MIVYFFFLLIVIYLCNIALFTKVRVHSLFLMLIIVNDNMDDKEIIYEIIISFC